MTPYIIVTKTSIDELYAEITSNIELGYTPQGGVSTVINPRNNNIVYTQAMILVKK